MAEWNARASSPMRVLLVAANASERMGGEAVLPVRYFVGLRRRGVDVSLMTHARCREELRRTLASDAGRVFYVEEHASETLVHRVSVLFPYHLRELLFLSLIHLITEYRLGVAARRLSTALKIDVIHQPTPVSPRAPSFLYRQPAALVIGPMNGNMDYPPAFRRSYAKGTRPIRWIGYRASAILNYLFPGKAEAVCLLAANERTAGALRRRFPRAKIEFLVENGVDLKAWGQPVDAPAQPVPKFLFVGRLVHWKAIDILIDAFRSLNGPAELLIIGDGPDRAKLNEQARSVQSTEKNIRFLGYLDHAELRKEMAGVLALVLPSLRESGGAVILEAMASSLPVISVSWGGPEDYVTNQTGFLIEPVDREHMVRRIAEQMSYLARNPEIVREMGEHGRIAVETFFSWDAKIERILAIYRKAVEIGVSR